MESKFLRNICRCPRSAIPLSSTILILSWILPPSSIAQLTSSQPSQTQLDPPPAATTTDSSTLNSVGDHAFNYYFLIVAFFAILLCVCIVWFGRRKRRKAAMMRSQSQRALARDVEGWTTRFRPGLGNNGVREGGTEEGLDERGEAPPPYAPGSKPPSIRSQERRIRDGGSGNEVELRRMSAGYNPPGYHEASSRGTDQDAGDITRPRTAVTASERLGSMRRLLDTTGSSSQA